MTADRDAARAARRAIPPQQRRAWSAAIAGHLFVWEAYRSARTVMAYVSVGAEVETAAILADVLACGKRLVLPRCEDGGRMTGRLAQDLSALERGPLGIPQPGACAPVVAPGTIDLFIVPGLLFDACGNRVGQGAGYYDRYLQGISAMTCGVCFAAQMVQGLAPAAHDVPMRAVLTQDGLLYAKREEKLCED